jgi:hypothetical protein
MIETVALHSLVQTIRHWNFNAHDDAKHICMMSYYSWKKVVGAGVLLLSLVVHVQAQVDTTYIYKTGTPFGTLDLRLAKSSTRYYYLKENETFSFRESAPGVKTKKFYDMTSWDSSPYMEGNLREKNGSADYYVLNYRLLLPGGYNATYSPGYPMIIMMHGMGERGNCWDNTCYHDDRTYNPNTNDPPAPTDVNSKLLNNDHNLLHGGKPHLDARNLAGSKLPNDPTLSSRAFPGFVLFPQNLNGWSSSPVQDAIRLIRLLVKKYNIDPDRIYIHGLSNGGIGVYEMIKRAPWLFAAALPMSAPSDASITSSNLTSTVAHIPMWMFQGGQDTAPTPARTAGYVKKFRDAGAIVKYTLYPNLGHGVWNTAYKEADFFKWMLAQTKAKIHVFGDNNAVCLSNGQGVRMELANGFRAYQWSKNGVVISGATSATYVANTVGTYRARFSRKANPTEADWNEWSAPVSVTTQSPPTPEIEQIGTVLLKDLNYYNYGRLKSKGIADKYYWYKNGALVNLSGSEDDTVRFPVLSSGSCTNGPCAGNGNYTLVTSTLSGCKSQPSAPISIYFSDQAPITITAPGSFAGQSNSITSVRLTWTDLSSNEKGFEIWRRTKTGTTYSKWEMRTITAANIKEFIDNAAPNTTYHYKIRAVSTSARSNYNPSSSSQYLVVTTSNETTPPSTPQTLTASTLGIGSIKLSWAASTDNTGIKQYRIYYDGTTVSTGSAANTFTLNDLPINKQYSFTVKAEDLAGNLSAASNAATGSTYVAGLYYEHSTGAWSNLDQINWNAVPEFTGHVDNFTLTPKTQADYFNFKFEGYLYLNTGGTYQFRTSSSDGSRVELDNVVVVNNDGVHGSKTITGPTQTLTAGPKFIVVKYFEYDGSENLSVQYKGPDTNNTWVTIPTSALRSGTPGTTMAMTGETEMYEPDSLAADPFTVNIFPNPSTPSDINVQVETQDESPVLVRIIDFSGREVFSGEYHAYEVNEGLRVQPTHVMDDGIYILLVHQNDKVQQRRLSIKN